MLCGVYNDKSKWNYFLPNSFLIELLFLIKVLTLCSLVSVAIIYLVVFIHTHAGNSKQWNIRPLFILWYYITEETPNNT